MNDREKALIEKIRAACESGIADDGLVLLDAGDVLGLVGEVQRYRDALQGWVASCDSCSGRGVLVFSRESAGKSPDRIDCAGCAPFRALLAESKDTQRSP